MLVVNVVTIAFWAFVAFGLLLRVVRRSTAEGRRASRGAGGPVVAAGAVESELYGFPTRVPAAPEPTPTSYSLVVDTPRGSPGDLLPPGAAAGSSAGSAARPAPPVDGPRRR